jgi:hypothetical protein
MLFWPRSPSKGWLPQPDGIRHRNSEREYLAKFYCSGLRSADVFRCYDAEAIPSATGARPVEQLEKIWNAPNAVS